MFPSQLINGTSVWKELLGVKCVYRFPVLRSSEMFLILRRISRNIFINMHNFKQICYTYLITISGIITCDK